MHWRWPSAVRIGRRSRCYATAATAAAFVRGLGKWPSNGGTCRQLNYSATADAVAASVRGCVPQQLARGWERGQWLRCHPRPPNRARARGRPTSTAGGRESLWCARLSGLSPPWPGATRSPSSAPLCSTVSGCTL